MVNEYSCSAREHSDSAHPNLKLTSKPVPLLQGVTWGDVYKNRFSLGRSVFPCWTEFRFRMLKMIFLLAVLHLQCYKIVLYNIK